MPPRTRSSTGSLKTIVKYEDSVDSESVDVEEQKLPKGNRRRVKAESESDYSASADDTVSEKSSNDKSTSSVVASEGVGPEDMDFGDEESNNGNEAPYVASPVRRKVSSSSRAHHEEGRLPRVSEHTLKESSEGIRYVLVTQIGKNEAAVRIVFSMSERYHQLAETSNPTEAQKACLLNEMSCILLHRLGDVGVWEAKSLRSMSFSGFGKNVIMQYFSNLLGAARDLLKDNSALSSARPDNLIPDSYTPVWGDFKIVRACN